MTDLKHIESIKEKLCWEKGTIHRVNDVYCLRRNEKEFNWKPHDLIIIQITDEVIVWNYPESNSDSIIEVINSEFEDKVTFARVNKSFELLKSLGYKEIDSIDCNEDYEVGNSYMRLAI